MQKKSPGASEMDPAARTFSFEEVMEAYPILPYFIHIGTIRSPNPWSFKPHTHSNHEIIVFRNGRVRVWINGEPFTARTGDCYVVLPGQTHQEKSLQKTIHFDYLKFTLWSHSGTDVHLIHPARIGQQHWQDREGFVGSCFMDMLKETRLHTPGGFERVHAILLQMVCHVRRTRKTILQHNPVTRIPIHLQLAVEQARQHLQQNLARPVSLTELGRVCNLSSDYLWHQFKQVEGKTPLQYAIHQRVAEAARLLQQTETSLDQIARQLGYSDPAFFSRQFKQVTGLSPGRFRRRSPPKPTLPPPT